MEYSDILLVISLLILSFGLLKMADLCDKMKNVKWKLLWLVPVFVSLIMIVFSEYDISMVGAYAGAIVLMLGFFGEKVGFRKRLSAAAMALTILTVPLCLFGGMYRRCDYTANFKDGFKQAKERYVLTKHKNIDWDALYKKYLPKFQEATKNQDEVANCIAWECFCAEFNDGHVGFAVEDEIYDEANDRGAGNDYGLVTMELSDGRVVALNVDDSLNPYGIHQFTEITSWDGMTVAEAAEKSVLAKMHGYADIDNEKFYEDMFAAGIGGDSVKVGFIADDGSEKTAELPKLENSYYDRLEKTMKTINRSYPAANMTIEKINDTTACLRMCAMGYDSESDKFGVDYAVMKKQIKNDFYAVKEQGVKDLIIDIRGNNGGSGVIVQTIAELLAPEGEHFYANNPKWDNVNKRYILDENGDYIIDGPTTFKGEDMLNGGKIVILVNSASVSAADHMTKVMSQFDNVTVMGFTEPNGSAQGVSAIKMKYGAMFLSSSVILDENGGIFIDSGEDRQSGDDLDIRVPFDEEAVHQLLEDDVDYLLEKAKELLKKQ